MTLPELTARLRKYASPKGVEDTMMAWLKHNKEQVKELQREQTFGLGDEEPENPAGIPWGTYSYNTRKLFNGTADKKGGAPYNLIDSGSFYQGHYVRVQKNVSIGSTSPSTKKILDNRFIDTSNGLFGFTLENEIRLKRMIGKGTAEWIKQGILK